MFKAIENGDFRNVDFDDDMSFAPSGCRSIFRRIATPADSLRGSWS